MPHCEQLGKALNKQPADINANGGIGMAKMIELLKADMLVNKASRFQLQHRLVILMGALRCWFHFVLPSSIPASRNL